MVLSSLPLARKFPSWDTANDRINTTIASVSDKQCFDIAWERQSGKCLVAWGEGTEVKICIAKKRNIFGRKWNGFIFQKTNCCNRRGSQKIIAKNLFAHCLKK